MGLTVVRSMMAPVSSIHEVALLGCQANLLRVQTVAPAGPTTRSQGLWAPSALLMAQLKAAWRSAAGTLPCQTVLAQATRGPV
eukprot:2182737-Heterocapsa_arctica.AAC.1